MRIPYPGLRWVQTNGCFASTSGTPDAQHRASHRARSHDSDHQLKPRQQKPPAYPTPAPAPKPAPKPPPMDPRPGNGNGNGNGNGHPPFTNKPGNGPPPFTNKPDDGAQQKPVTTPKPSPTPKPPAKPGGTDPKTQSQKPVVSPNANAVVSAHSAQQTKVVEITITKGTIQKTLTKTLTRFHDSTDSTGATPFVPEFPSPTDTDPSDPFSDDPSAYLPGTESQPSPVPVIVGVTLGSLVLLGIIVALIWRSRGYRTPWRNSEKNKLPNDMVIPDAGYWPNEKTPMPIPRVRTPRATPDASRAVSTASRSTARLFGSDDGHSGSDRLSSADGHSSAEGHSHLVVQHTSLFGRMFSSSSSRSATPLPADSRSGSPLPPSHPPARALLPPASPSSAAPLISVSSPTSSRTPQFQNPFSDPSESGHGYPASSDSGHGHSSDSGHDHFTSDAGHSTSETSHTYLLSSHRQPASVSSPFTDAAIVSPLVDEPVSIVPTPSHFGDKHVAAAALEGGDSAGKEGQHSPVAGVAEPSTRPTPARADTMNSMLSLGLGNDPPPEYKARGAVSP